MGGVEGFEGEEGFGGERVRSEVVGGGERKKGKEKKKLNIKISKNGLEFFESLFSGYVKSCIRLKFIFPQFGINPSPHVNMELYGVKSKSLFGYS